MDTALLCREQAMLVQRRGVGYDALPVVAGYSAREHSHLPGEAGPACFTFRVFGIIVNPFISCIRPNLERVRMRVHPQARAHVVTEICKCLCSVMLSRNFQPNHTCTAIPSDRGMFAGSSKFWSYVC